MARRRKFDAYEADRVPQILAFEAWDRKQRRARPFAGLAFFRPASDASTIIASRHWPHLLCWQWLLSWKPYRADETRRWLKLYRDTDTWTLHVARLGFLYFKRQRYDRMAARGPDRAPWP